ncbi:MAG: hypothetical protein KUG79_01950 [Pseudomonadales bacterium]|nr:hypothetical protein [Pseudomonadales bacterium]
MAEHLFLRLSEKPDCAEQLIEWMLLDETSGIVRFRGSSEPSEFTTLLVDLDWNGRTYVMLAGEEVLLTLVDIPSKQQRQIQRAVPFMVEENLATDVDHCHFAMGGRDDAGLLNVAVIASERMQYWLEAIKNLGIKPDFVTVDTQSVPCETDCSIMLDSERALIRQCTSTGLVVPTDLLATTINLLPDADKENLSLAVCAAEQEASALLIAQINAEQVDDIKIVQLDYSPFEVLCREMLVGSGASTAINLLQGDYKVEQVKRNRPGSWRSVMILAASVFALHIALLLGQGIFLDIRALEYEASSRQIYQDIFPNDRRVHDILRRWRAHLGKGSEVTGGQFLSLFASTAGHIPGSSLQLNNVNFNESRGDLVLQLETPRSDELIRFSETLVKMGLSAEIGTINQVEGAVRGSIKIKTAEGS